MTALAKFFSKPRHSVRAACEAVAFMWLRAQERMLENIMGGLRAANARLSFFFEKLRWDETKQRVSLTLAGADGNHCATWNVMVSRWRLHVQSCSRLPREVYVADDSPPDSNAQRDLCTD